MTDRVQKVVDEITNKKWYKSRISNLEKYHELNDHINWYKNIENQKASYKYIKGGIHKSHALPSSSNGYEI